MITTRSRTKPKAKAVIAQVQAALALSLYAELEAVDDQLAACFFETDLIGQARSLLAEVLGRVPTRPAGWVRPADMLDMHAAAMELLRLEGEAIWHWRKAKHPICHAAELVFQAGYAEGRRQASQDSI